MATGLLAAFAAGNPALAVTAQETTSAPAPVETRVAAPGASLYARIVGRGQPVIVLHGGPDFDHAYLLPELDQLATSHRLIYYDQRGRGRSVEGVRADDVTLASDIEDIDQVRQHFDLDRVTLLGHSWGVVLALEYAVRHPERVSRLILMNPAPASASDFASFRKIYIEKLGPEMSRQQAMIASPAYRDGDPAAVTARYRIHFKPALVRTDDYDRLMSRMQAAFASQGRAGILRARAIEDRLRAETWQDPAYDLLPKLGGLHIPALVIAGERDFIPIEIANHIAQALPGAKLVVMKDCGHFSYLECAPDVRRALEEFDAGARSALDRRPR
ncbi:MAG TPA: alpha/beta fold hydrolase [Gemmatimonadaceae bacterium]|nr:alpha/beta fold hydrolase [Gemmatimonadaceae bacterium]